MNLRAKIITTVTLVMLFSLLILMMSVVFISMYSENNRKREVAHIAQKTFSMIYKSSTLEEFKIFLDSCEFVSDWRVMKGDRVLAGSETTVIGKMFSTVLLRDEDPSEKLLFIIRGDAIIKTPHYNFIITGIICTFLLVVILYLLLSRLVIKPVDIVIEASRLAGKGLKPGNNPIPSRNDEAGIMVREFYDLLAEIYEYRMSLEEKIKDISLEMQKANEKLIVSQRLSATGKLAAGIAHEINNPLGGMLNAVNKLHKSIKTDKEREYFDLLKECIQRIENLVKEMLSFVRTQKDFAEVKLEKCIDFAERMVSQFLKEKNIQLIKHIKGQPAIMGDAGEIQQMILNIFLNSIDSIEHNEGRIEVAVSRDDSKGNILLTITDNGCGIPEELLDGVFDLFYTSKEVGKGSGFGLSIVHSIVKNHRGAIEIKSEAGKMTAVIIVFPEKKESLQESDKA